MLIFYRFEPDDAYKKNAYKKKRVGEGYFLPFLLLQWQKPRVRLRQTEGVISRSYEFGVVFLARATVGTSLYVPLFQSVSQ